MHAAKWKWPYIEVSKRRSIWVADLLAWGMEGAKAGRIHHRSSSASITDRRMIVDSGLESSVCTLQPILCMWVWQLIDHDHSHSLHNSLSVIKNIPLCPRYPRYFFLLFSFFFLTFGCLIVQSNLRQAWGLPWPQKPWQADQGEGLSKSSACWLQMSW